MQHADRSIKVCPEIQVVFEILFSNDQWEYLY